MSRYSILHEIQQLDPLTDHQRIVFLSSCYDFPFDTTRALEFALFRTFCAPRISELLDRTGEFRQRVQKRYDDTDIIISEMLEHGYDSERGGRALARMNQIHGRFAINNEDLLYVLSTFIYEPIRWNARYGWRPLCEQERLGFFYFWRNIGLRMKIAEIPEDYEMYETFNRDYEQRNFRFCETNQRTGAATRELFVSWFPRAAAPLVRSAIYALLDPPLLEAFGFPSAPWPLRSLVSGTLWVRARALRFFPPRKHPRLRTGQTYPSYPDGYTIENIGPRSAPHRND
ncbi:hypothetical protein CA54_10980 [Symmachiella macrocystis]|uniref:ER-bound oxygenase mpaB/mpaB'/Rubber oxygenase catalytic domain-containing protein n=1 Tax=Symmachiella macrocystis TaxID=2527985 RepID=A0A5C6BJS7_9PLAN|nr:oxygenase MpaB family protein [Symmachiella macrocystis]TWU12275.1 hypothetical protein CA54_10980 [Symmachiella macrocystis]